MPSAPPLGAIVVAVVSAGRTAYRVVQSRSRGEEITARRHEQG
jgi:hypothetical protein